MPNKIPDSDIIDDIIRVISITGSKTFKNYKIYGKYAETTINSHFGSWSNAMEHIGIVPEHLRNISKEDIVQDVMFVFSSTGITTREHYLKTGKFSRAPIQRLFGSWNAMLRELEFDVNMEKKITKDELMNDIKAIYEKFGTISSCLYRKHGKYSQCTVDRIFGSFANVLKELGLSIYGRYITNQEIESAGIEAFAKFGFLEKKIVDEFFPVSYPTVIHRYGSIENFCKAIGMPSYNESKMSKFARFVLTICKDILGTNYCTEQTFEWLRNPITNRKMFIDIYYPELNLAIEVDGGQHYARCNLFHKTPEHLLVVQQRDRDKDNLLQSHNINIERILYSDSIDDITIKLSRYLLPNE